MKKYSKDKNISNKVKLLKRSGWMYRQGKKHGMIISPGGVKLSIPGTPSDWRSWRNFNCEVNRIEFSEKYNVI